MNQPTDHPRQAGAWQPYLRLLSHDFPTQRAAAAEIVRLKTRLQLPKGTEYFFSDLHGEHQGFLRMLKSASGTIRDKIDTLFYSALTPEDRDELAQVIYDPEGMLRKLEAEGRLRESWYHLTIVRLVQVLKMVSAKYTRSMARERMAADFRSAIDELTYKDEDESRMDYHYAVIRAILDTGVAGDFIRALSGAIRSLSVARLHIIGDVFDRGAHPDMIMDELIAFHDVDIQWGNHDILWLGASLGNEAMIANVLRQGINYSTFDLLEDGYGINLRPLSMFADSTYRDDPCEIFKPKNEYNENLFDTVDPVLGAKMLKAMTVIQLKLEGQLLARRPEYGMADRDVLSRADFEKGSVVVDGREHALRDTRFPTVDPKNPLALSPGESELMRSLVASFRHSRRLQSHMRFLVSHGSIYLRFNGNLLYHGCVPLREDGGFEALEMDGQPLSGKALFDYIDRMARDAAYQAYDSPRQVKARDFLWYLWCGPKSPVFGKDRMATFERAFLSDKATHKETMNPYYRLINQEETCRNILLAFGLDPGTGHIVNGHVPVKLLKGESPIKGNGRLFMIDGGMSKAYQKTTGMGGYTLIINSHSIALAQHPSDVAGDDAPFDSPTLQVVERFPSRMTVAQTDESAEMRRQIEDLGHLIAAYQAGKVSERGQGPDGPLQFDPISKNLNKQKENQV